MSTLLEEGASSSDMFFFLRKFTNDDKKSTKIASYLDSAGSLMGHPTYEGPGVRHVP